MVARQKIKVTATKIVFLNLYINTQYNTPSSIKTHCILDKTIINEENGLKLKKW